MIVYHGTCKGFVLYWPIAFCDSKKVSSVQWNPEALANSNVIANPGNRANLRVSKFNQGERAGWTCADFVSESEPEQIAFSIS